MSLNYFFSALSLYFFLLLTFTFMRKHVTYLGIFYVLTLSLMFFVVYMSSLFNDVLLNFAVCELQFSFTTHNWVSLDLSLSLKIDCLSYLFVLLVLVIGLATNFYSSNYLKYEAHEDVFILLINWFIFSMIILVLANNLFTLFLGWESIGLSSFFLINFWNTRRGTLKSSFKAFFFNKISDVFLFLFLILINRSTLSNDLTDINMQLLVGILDVDNIYFLSSLFLFSCTLFKSAQLFGHLWLPDSMEAPVPASALIHSATLVSAGIYLLLRFTPLINLNQIQLAISLIGSVTAAYGGLVSASQTDMKKLLAYSTISHCGFLFVSIGTEVYLSSVIYLFLHGLFKAATFFCAGSFIRVAGSQDTRNMGSLSRVLPVDTAFLIICAFNLGGLPFSLGALYKSILISSLLNSSGNVFVLGLSCVGLLSSVIYVYRLVYYSAFDTSKEFFSPMVYELQQKSNNVVDYWSATSIVQILAVTIIFLFTIWVYIHFNSLLIQSDLFLDHSPIVIDCDSSVLAESTTYRRHFYEIFYSLYTLVCCSLCVVNYRVEYTFNYRIKFILMLLCSSLFLSLFSLML